VVLVFRSKRADRVKILFWDTAGWCWFGSSSSTGRFAGAVGCLGPERGLSSNEDRLFQPIRLEASSTPTSFPIPRCSPSNDVLPTFEQHCGGIDAGLSDNGFVFYGPEDRHP
jgi:hypothetical protein